MSIPVLAIIWLSLPTPAISRPLGSVDVTAFGAKGDGITDDTAAIQKAADAAAARTVVLQPPGGAGLGSSPPVYFPSGRYKISGEINFGAYSNILSDAKAIVEQTGDCRSFVFSGGYTVTVTGISFVGGTNQIYYSNANIDSSLLLVDNCEFQLCKEYAIHTVGTTDGHLSANLVIEKCKFMVTNKVLHNVCDAAAVRDCWVTIGSANFVPDSAAFMNRSGTLIIDNLLGVPNFDSLEQDRARWVDNYDQLLVTRSRFGGENGGIPIVFHFGNPDKNYPWMGQTISIEHSQISAGLATNPNASVITLRSGVPQLIRIIGNRYLMAPCIRVEGMNLDAYLRDVTKASTRFEIAIDSNMAHPQALSIPRQLRRFTEEDKRPKQR